MMNIEPTIREYLPNVIHMSLATAANNTPWICEVHYAFDDQLNLYFRSKPSRRHSQEIAANPHIAGNIVRQHGQGEVPLGIYFEGTAELLSDVTAEHPAFICLKTRFDGLRDEILAEATEPDGHKFYKITVATWYAFGKLDDTGVHKHSLPWKAA